MREKGNRKRILNIGCGDDMYGTDRFDIKKTGATTKVGNVEKMVCLIRMKPLMK